MIEFCDHAKARLNERLPELAGMIAEIEESVTSHVKTGYAENVDFWCKTPPRQCLRVIIFGMECYAIVNHAAIVTVFGRDLAVQIKYAQKHKKRLKSCKNQYSRYAK